MTNNLPLDRYNNPISAISPDIAIDSSDLIVQPKEITRIVRICAITDCRIWSYLTTASGDGVLLTAGSTEYFVVPADHLLRVDGQANIMG